MPALAGRSLSNSRFMRVLSSNSQGLKSSKASIEFMSRYSKTFIVKYVQAFNYGVFNYFLSVQHMDVGSSEMTRLETKLARLCLNDLSFTKSYTEMPMRCVSGSVTEMRSVHYNELVSARVVRVESEGYYLVGLFQETSRMTFNDTLPQERDDSAREPIKQAVCMFSLEQIQQKITENLRKCYDSGTHSSDQNVMRGLSFIKPDQRCSQTNSRSRNLYQQQKLSANGLVCFGELQRYSFSPLSTL